jgi:glycosyltransferase involved in cell wall biosynthesis
MIANRRQPVAGLRLLLAAPTYYPYYSGAAERFRRYLPGFRTRGIEVTVFSASPTIDKAGDATRRITWTQTPIGGFLPQEEDLDGVPVVRVRLPESSKSRRAALFARSLRAYCSDAGRGPDVVQVFGLAPGAVPELWRLRRMGIRTVTTRTMMPALPRNPVKRSIRRAMIRLPSGLVSCCVVANRAMFDAFRDIGVRHRMEIIPHGVDLERFRPAHSDAERQSIRFRFGIPDSAEIILFAGSIEPRKGVHRLVTAWCQLAAARPNLHLVLAGPRWEATAVGQDYYQSLQDLAKRCHAHDRVHFLGRVSEIEELMRAADLFVLPSSREGMPNVMGEAMASGVPVMATPFSGLSREFGKRGVHYVLTEFNPEAMASDIASLLDAPEWRAEVARHGRAWAVQHLNVTTSIDSYARLYRELAIGRPLD